MGWLRRLILAHDSLDPPFVLSLVLLEHVVCLSLGRRFRVGVVQQILDAQQNLLDSNGWLPCLLLVQDGQTYRARRIDVGVEERWYKLAYMQ